MQDRNPAYETVNTESNMGTAKSRDNIPDQIDDYDYTGNHDDYDYMGK